MHVTSTTLNADGRERERDRRGLGGTLSEIYQDHKFAVSFISLYVTLQLFFFSSISFLLPSFLLQLPLISLDAADDDYDDDDDDYDDAAAAPVVMSTPDVRGRCVCDRVRPGSLEFWI